MSKARLQLFMVIILIILSTLIGCKQNSYAPSLPNTTQDNSASSPVAPSNPLVNEPIKPATTTNSSGSQTAAYSWWFTRNSQHQVPTTNAQISQLLAANQAFYALPNNSKKIYLTFDCGYELSYTPQILDTLSRKHVSAAFFITGQYIKTHPELVRQMRSNGHLVCSHTMNHPDLTTISQTKFNQEMQTLEQKYTDVTGEQLAHYLRPPEGKYSATTLKWAQELGYTTVFWSMALVDWDPNKQPGAAFVTQHVLDNIHPGAVILFHVVSQSDTEALEGIITTLQAQGYVFSLFS
jgi:peptidoglycan-N-acetylmuramic acid deacetylase